MQKKSSGCVSGCQNAFSAFSGAIVEGLESSFYSYGISIGRNPFLFIIFCLIFTGVCSIGLIKFKTDESDTQFMATNSQFKGIMDWNNMNPKQSTYEQIILFEAEDILDKYVLLEMLQIRNKIINITADDLVWDDLCAERSMQENCNTEIPSEYDNYCDMQQSMKKECWEESILKLWEFDSSAIDMLTQEDILLQINSDPKNQQWFSKAIGKLEKNTTNGDILGGKAVGHKWVTNLREKSSEWEKEFIKMVDKLMEETDNVSIFYSTSSSFGKIVSEDIGNDVRYFVLGYVIVFIYVSVMLGKFNFVEQRPILSALGIICVGMAILVSYGLGSAFGIPFGAINTILPFLLLGLGIDDMFVIITAFNNLPQQDQHKELTERIGITLKHAGVSITVTSVTDFLAFLIGSSTVLPSLRSFCLYAAIGIGSVYFFQATFFVACLTLDQRRLEDNRHGLIFCWKLKNWHPNACSQIDFCKTFFVKVYSSFIFQLPVKIFILLFTCILFCVSCWGVSNLKQEFDPIWFLPPASTLAKYLDRSNFYYPMTGVYADVIFRNMDYREWPKAKQFEELLKESESINSVDSWFTKFEDHLYNQNVNISEVNQTESEFLGNLTDFLYSCEGSRYRRKKFYFAEEVNCTGILPMITAVKISYQHKKLKTTKEKIDALEDVQDIVTNVNFQGDVIPYTRLYINWETNFVIGKELLQNMGLAVLMVFLVTLILLASLQASIIVMICVFATLVDVGALIHWWGLTIDTISAIDLVLAIGLSVDYSVHIAHTFMIIDGSRDERARAAVGTIGPAVLNGGFSTFLSFAFLANSESYVFKTFFKIFFSVCLYGVFHGLVFLPVILSFLGPAPYATARPSSLVPKNKIDNPSIPIVMPVIAPSPPNFKSPSPPRSPSDRSLAVLSPADLDKRAPDRPNTIKSLSGDRSSSAGGMSESPDIDFDSQMLLEDSIIRSRSSNPTSAVQRNTSSGFHH